MLKTHERIAVLDDFKGFMLFFYIFVQVMTLPKTFATPEWFAHSKIGGQALPFLSISISDFGPALFFFVIGMAAVCAFENRVKRDGLKAARRHYLYRNLAVVGRRCAVCGQRLVRLLIRLERAVERGVCRRFDVSLFEKRNLVSSFLRLRPACVVSAFP